jgi:hypothetical protein
MVFGDKMVRRTSILGAKKYEGTEDIGNYIVFIVQAYQTSQYAVPPGGNFPGKWRSSFAINSDGKMNVQSACDLNTR